jgi:SAM-dependent methyltransferase
MKPRDSKRIVAAGYDRIAERYASWAAGIHDAARECATRLLLDALPPGAAVLELGCGNGLPTAKRLAKRFLVTGVDISARQVALARRNVPGAVFQQADMAALEFAPESFDAVIAFYSLTHLPRQEHATLLATIARWLRPGGLFAASMGAGAADGVEDDWLGAPMFFSHFDAETNRRLVEATGLALRSASVETLDEHGNPVSFLWVIAQKPSLADPC